MAKLIIIANRLPITIEQKDTGFIYKQSIGGVATGMSSLSSGFNCTWLGFTGICSETLTEAEMLNISTILSKDFRYQPVFLTKQEIKNYYEGFSNETLWPLFHYFPIYTRFENIYWETYYKVNVKFSLALKEIYEEGDLIWIQDYHLTLLPSLVRNLYPQARIGFFLHIPFPAYEVFRLLPWRKEIIEGLLGSDLIGFHTPSYVQHFLDNVHRFLGYENIFGEIRLPQRNIKVETYPMGIDYKKFESAGSLSDVKKHLKQFNKVTEKYRLILSVDRLDYSKGILERLKCLEYFLEKYPQYHNKIICIVVAVPSRTNVAAYENLAVKLNETVGRINGKYETLGWAPIRYINRAMDFYELSALYSLSEIALVTPLRDGMNLVAKEYVAAQKNGNGVLIISEMAGVSEELGEAILVNPHNIEQVADAIHEGFKIPLSERRKRMRPMQERLKKNDIFKWACSFAQNLSSLSKEHYNYAVKWVDETILSTIQASYKLSAQRLILLDYDGTLVPFKQKPEGSFTNETLKGQLRNFIRTLNIYHVIRDDVLEKQLNNLLGTLSKDPKNQIFIISGRNQKFLEKRFRHLSISLIGEHGAWLKLRGLPWAKTIEHEPKWKDFIRPLFELYMERAPGALIEEKDFSLAWHYRMVKEPLANTRVRELKSTILSTIANMNLKVLEGNKVLEVKNAEINKGKITRQLLSQKQYDFILSIGDDQTDEDMFNALPEAGISIKVGEMPTSARYRVAKDTNVRQILANLINYSKK